MGGLRKLRRDSFEQWVGVGVEVEVGVLQLHRFETNKVEAESKQMTIRGIEMKEGCLLLLLLLLLLLYPVDYTIVPPGLSRKEN